VNLGSEKWQDFFLCQITQSPTLKQTPTTWPYITFDAKHQKEGVASQLLANQIANINITNIQTICKEIHIQFYLNIKVIGAVEEMDCFEDA
jgi:hypothetical protein